MFPDKFNITSIERIVYVSQNEYKEKITSFSENVIRNELIYNLSGCSDIYFNKKHLLNKEDSIRFLPAGLAQEYTVLR